MKFKVKISKFHKMFFKDDDNLSMYYAIDEYLRIYHDVDISLYTIALKHALFKMVKRIDRSKLAIDIFVEKPKFTYNCPTNLVKSEYQKFFIDSDGCFSSQKFIMLLALAGVKKFTIKCDATGYSDVQYKRDDTTE